MIGDREKLDPAMFYVSYVPRSTYSTQSLLDLNQKDNDHNRS